MLPGGCDPCSILRMKVTLLLLFASLFTLNLGAIISNFEYKALELELALKKKLDISNLIESINVESRQYKKKIDLKYYIRIKERMTKALYEYSDSVSVRKSNQKFAVGLVEDINENLELFSSENFMNVFCFLFSAASSENKNEITETILKLMPRIRSEELIINYEYFSKLMTAEASVIFKRISESNFDNFKAIRIIFDDFIDTWFYENNDLLTPADICTTIFLISSSGLIVSDSSFSLLLARLNDSCYDYRSALIYEIFAALEQLFDRISSNENLTRLLINFMVNEWVINELDSTEVNKNYLGLIFRLIQGSKYFENAIKVLSSSLLTKLNIYLSQINVHTKAVVCFGHLLNLNTNVNPSDSTIRLANSAITNLRSIQQTNPFIYSFLPESVIPVFKLTNARILSNLNRANSSKIKESLLNLSAEIAFLDFDIFESQQDRAKAAYNIGLSIGMLIDLSNTSGTSYPIKYLEKLLVNFVEIGKMFLSVLVDFPNPMPLKDLASYMSFAKLYQNHEILGKLMPQSICFFYVATNSLENRPYEHLIQWETDLIPNVYSTTIQESLLKHLKGTDKNLKSLREYFYYMENHKLLNKSESEIIKKALKINN